LRKARQIVFSGSANYLFHHVKISVLFVGLFCLATPVWAQDPGAQQDAEAAREKLLKAADQLDLIESNSEASKASLENMKADIAKLQDANATLKQQLIDLQAAFDKAEAAHAKERQVLLDEVAKMVAAGKGSTKPARKKDVAAEAPAQVKTPEPETAASNSAPAANNDASSTSTTGDSAASQATTAEATPTKPQKGYYHVVESGETLTLICTAYRQQGISVTVAEIQKANGLSEKSVLKVGQKLFIPKPGA